MEQQSLDDRIKDLEAQIADLKSRFPAHSLKAAMFAQLEEMEEQLAVLQKAKEEGQA